MITLVLAKFPWLERLTYGHPDRVSFKKRDRGVVCVLWFFPPPFFFPRCVSARVVFILETRLQETCAGPAKHTRNDLPSQKEFLGPYVFSSAVASKITAKLSAHMPHLCQETRSRGQAAEKHAAAGSGLPTTYAQPAGVAKSGSLSTTATFSCQLP